MVTYPKIVPTASPEYPKMTGVASGAATKREVAESGAWPKVHVVEEEGYPKVVLLSTLLADATTSLGGIEPLHYWDFTTDRCIFDGLPWGTVGNTPGWAFTRATGGIAEDIAGNTVEFSSGQLRRTNRGLLLEGSRTNLFLNSATGVTQDVEVTAAVHTLSFRGTGTITLSGASTAGPLVGTGVNDRVSLVFTPLAGTLTCTVSGTCTNVQLELGTGASSYIATVGASATRNADILVITAPRITFPTTLWVEFERQIDTGVVEQMIIADDNTDNERVGVNIDNTDLLTGTMVDGGASQAIVTVAGSVALNTVYRGAARFNTNSVQAARSGTLGTEDTVGTLPTTPTHIRFGVRASGIRPFFGYIRRAAVFNTALSDADLQTITT